MAFPSIYNVHHYIWREHARSPSVSLTLLAAVSFLLGTISDQFGLKEGIKRCSVCKLKSQKDYLHI